MQNGPTKSATTPQKFRRPSAVDSSAVEIKSVAADWVRDTQNPIEVLFRAAAETGVVLLSRQGFGAVHPAGRASLSNLDEYE